MTKCPNCRELPTLTQHELDVHYECAGCGLHGSSYNRMSNDYAFTNAEESWDRMVRLQSAEKVTVE